MEALQAVEPGGPYVDGGIHWEEDTVAATCVLDAAVWKWSRTCPDFERVGGVAVAVVQGLGWSLREQTPKAENQDNRAGQTGSALSGLRERMREHCP